MKTTPTTKTSEICWICGKVYRGANTVPVNTGYGRYRNEPAHVKCAKNWK